MFERKVIVALSICLYDWLSSYGFSSLSGYAGRRYANSRGLLPDCVGEAGHGFPDSWSLLWEEHLSLSGLYEASEHLGHAAGPKRFTKGSDHVISNWSHGQGAVTGFERKSEWGPWAIILEIDDLQILLKPPHICIWWVTNVELNCVRFVLLQVFCHLRPEVRIVMVYAWKSHHVL